MIMDNIDRKADAGKKAHIDRNLLFLISEDARAKVKDLSRQLRKSQPRLLYNLKGYMKSGLITYPHCIFDYSYFGLLLFRVYFKGGYVGEKDKESIIKKLVDNPYIVSIYEFNGEFDLAIDIESPNPSRFNKELKRVAELVPTLNNYKIILNLVTHIYPRTYLPLSKKMVLVQEGEIIVGGDREVQQFSGSEMEIMKNLLASPRITYTDLAKNSCMNVKTARSVFRNLQKRKLIKGFKFDIDTNALGISRVRLFLGLHNLSVERENQLVDYMLRVPEIVRANKTVGDWDMEIDMESDDKTRIRTVTLQIRETFKDLIEEFNMIEFYKYYKRSYLPGYLFMKDAPAGETAQKQTSLESFK